MPDLASHAHLLSYALDDGIATLTMDDGKVNAMSVAMLEALHAAFDQAESDAAVVLLTGRDGIFSAGFDLKVFPQGQEKTLEMLRLGATLAERVMSFPYPVVTACTGHAYPMGAFLMLSADRRLGIDGPLRIGMNEVAIGLGLPQCAVEIARQRLAPAYFQRIVTGDMYAPDEAVTAGFLDELVAPEALAARSRDVAEGLREVDFEAYRQTQARIREAGLKALRAAIETDLGG
ncbi:MAG: crotonase/enoyl-CoA hydratase family protein [Proteobacteria bacterium]|nr:crotonase/enoyl-CoA hydratase family protein [Pseudomonadota bacterium]